jgi:hypothetical protein
MSTPWGRTNQKAQVRDDSPTLPMNEDHVTFRVLGRPARASRGGPGGDGAGTGRVAPGRGQVRWGWAGRAGAGVDRRGGDRRRKPKTERGSDRRQMIPSNF